MPTYQYSCTACGHGFEIVQSFADDALTVCPECSGRLRKVFNAVGVVFKGSGFYRTDSRAAQDSKPDGAKSDGTKSDGAKSDGKQSESKSDAKKPDAKKSDSTSSSSKSKAPAPSSV